MELTCVWDHLHFTESYRVFPCIQTALHIEPISCFLEMWRIYVQCIYSIFIFISILCNQICKACELITRAWSTFNTMKMTNLHHKENATIWNLLSRSYLKSVNKTGRRSLDNVLQQKTQHFHFSDDKSEKKSQNYFPSDFVREVFAKCQYQWEQLVHSHIFFLKFSEEYTC